ncbi:acyl-CoA thioesterase [Deinococcus lacus]|uniref:Acyl-CoA thioesterase n=1 Tax=Deinococcus lacus TaxID=392561 RepID=A0ABW1YB90_9DEIO
MKTHPLADLDWSRAHTAPIQMRYSDADAMGHLNNAVYVQYLETARVLMMQDLGGDINALLTVLARIELDYVREIRLGQTVEVQTLLEHVGRSSYSFVVRMMADGEPCAYGRTVQVNVGTDKRPAPLSDEWMRRMAPYAAPGVLPGSH